MYNMHAYCLVINYIVLQHIIYIYYIATCNLYKFIANDIITIIWFNGYIILMCML